MFTSDPPKSLEQPVAGGDEDGRTGILTATRGVHAPPEMRPGSGRPQRRFVVLLLAAAALLVATVAGANVLVDPYATVGTGVVGAAVWTDRTVKTRLIDKLTTPPQVVILGSSRAMKVEPSYLTRRLGRPAFNAAVSSGRPVDAYVFARYLRDRFPETTPDCLWLLDQEAFADNIIDPTLLADADLAGYLPSTQRWRSRANDLSWLFSWQTLKLSWQTWRKAETAKAEDSAGAASTLPAEGDAAGRQPEFAADGFRTRDANDRRAQRGRKLSKGIAASLRIFTRRYRSGYPGLASQPREYFERTLKTMNDWGTTPVIVLSPMHPQMLRELIPLGWEKRHRQVLAYLRTLEDHYRFVLLDDSRIASFHGSPRSFYDGVHMTTANYRRLVDAALADPQAAAALAAGAR